LPAVGNEHRDYETQAAVKEMNGKVKKKKKRPFILIPYE
jgi:hypothetical protein